MQRFIVYLFLLTYAVSGLTASFDTGAPLSAKGERAVHELHLIHSHVAGDECDGEAGAGETSVQHEEAEHHFCQHNLLGLVLNVPVVESIYLPSGAQLEPAGLTGLELFTRLLRPPQLMS